MKKQVFTLLGLCLMALMIAGCGGPIEEMQFKSPNGDNVIEIKGERESPAAPITVGVTITSPKGSESFKFEHQAGSLTKDNVKPDWLDNNRCNITFTYDDGKTWVLEVYVTEDKIQAIRNFEIDGKRIFR
ncbi:MAG: hypothetical protein U0176_02355 [Bacteroidia bacterium]